MVRLFDRLRAADEADIDRVPVVANLDDPRYLEALLHGSTASCAPGCGNGWRPWK
ncbi:MAG: hypothetical protein RBU25_01015 [Lentisphaeria bacterium]|jgi:hypothetical protein|nr:hypothetical protein [Lentisphaeria bacterium]